MSPALQEWRAEQVTATVLFADLVGFDRLETRSGTESAYLAVTHVMRLLDGVARKHGGSVDKYLGDKLMAVFGHPLPLGNPARAASLAALEMRQLVAEYDREADLAEPLGIHIGINTGEFVSGDIRGPVVREFHVLGDAVNVAARINARAPEGEIWVGASVQGAVEGEFRWRALESMAFKGKRQRVPTFALEGSRGPVVREGLGFDERLIAGLFGRNHELARLREHVHGLAGGQGGWVRLIGAAGSGKSRLLGALGDADEMRPVGVLQVQATAIDRERRLGTFGALLESASPGVPEMDAATAADALAKDLSARARAKPLLFVIEDVQWMDEASRTVLEALLGLGRDLPILFITSERPEAGETEPQGVIAASIALGPLDAEHARALVVEALGEGVDDASVELVLRRGGALPGALLHACFLAPALLSESEQEEGREERSREAERRRAVVVFADITGFTSMTEEIGAERAYPIVAACLEILDETAREFGGTVDHYLGDCVMALFGIPRAIEDAPRAALNAAIAMRQRIRAFNEEHELAVPIDLHTGVATGLGIAGDISGPMIREFAVMGAHVDRADALTHEAKPGEVRLDEATHHATRDVFRFSAGGSEVLPGAPGPQATYLLLSDSPQLHRTQVGAGRQVFSELVGREEQVEALRSAIAGLATGHGAIVSLSAEAGIGKSRLLTEISRSVEAARTTWLVGRALSNGHNLRYHPIADLLRSWAGINDEDGAGSARGKLDDLVAAVLPEDSGDSSTLLANLSGQRLSPDEEKWIGSIQGEAAEKIIRGTFVRLLRAATAEEPVVIIMEDLHWADLSTVELVESILGLSAEYPVLFVNAFRPGFPETSNRVLEVARERFADLHVELTLSPLDADAARTMVKNLFSGGDVPRETRAAIEERARGNPFYIEEVVRTLVDAGAVEVHEGAFRATEKLASVEIPNTVQEAVMARVDRLDLSRRSILQAASVIGGTFHLDVLEEMPEVEHVEEQLRELEAAEFIVPSDRTAGVEYAFKHPLIQEVTYDSLLEARRQELHLAVAAATELRLAETMPSYSAMLAYHFSKGRDAERAEEYLFRAGDEASRSAASNEALHFFQQASALYDELHPDGGKGAKRARLEKSLAVALANRGQLIDAAEHFDTTAGLLGRPSPRGALGMTFNLVVNLTRLLGRLYLGRPYGKRPAEDADRELIDVMFRRAMAQSTTNPTRFFVDATALVRTVAGFDPRSVPEAAAIYSGITAVFSLGGLSFNISRRCLDVAEEMAQAGAVDERLLYYRTLRFLHHLLEGDWSEDHTIDPAIVEEGIREGRFWEASTYLDLDCQRQVYQGNFKAVEGRIDQLAELVDLYENDLASSARLGHTAMLHVERRELDAALKAVDLYYDEHAEVLFNVVALGTRARISALQGRLEAAADDLASAEELMREAGRVPPLHASYVHSARFLLDMLVLEREVAAGRKPTAAAFRRVRRSRKTALATARNVAWRRAEALRLAGREAWLRGRPAQAISWWERALDCAEGLGARPELGRTWADAGRALAGSGSPSTLRGRDAGACLQEAREVFEALDLAVELSQLSEAA